MKVSLKQQSMILAIGLSMAVLSHVYAQERRPPITSPRPAQPTVNNAGPKVGILLLETELYKLYTHNHTLPSNNIFNKWCFLSSNGIAVAHLSLVYKVDADYLIVFDDAYKKRLEKEIIPAVKRHCNSVSEFTIMHYIDGVRIAAYDMKEYNYNQVVPMDAERAINGFVIMLDKHAEITHKEYPDGITSLADLRKKRDSQNSALAKREADAEDARREREKAKALEQQRKDEIESKGGLEPTSNDLAVAYTRDFKIGLPLCPNLEDKKWCEWSINVWVQLKGGTKISCKPEVLGQDYHCKYNLDYDCLVRGPKNEAVNNPIACGAWTILSTKTVETGVRRTPRGWAAYPLPNRDKKK